MVDVEDLGSAIEVYFKDRIIVTLIEEDWGIEVYDYINDQYVTVESNFIRGALDEIKPYLESMVSAGNNKSLLDRIKEELW